MECHPRSRTALVQTVAFEKGPACDWWTHKLGTNNHDDGWNDLSVAPAPLRTLDFLSSLAWHLMQPLSTTKRMRCTP